jgi:hypothetical protein
MEQGIGILVSVSDINRACLGIAPVQLLTMLLSSSLEVGAVLMAVRLGSGFDIKTTRGCNVQDLLQALVMPENIYSTFSLLTKC